MMQPRRGRNAWTSSVTSTQVFLIVTLLTAFILVPGSQAQSRERRYSVGGMVGKTAGASLKMYVNRAYATDVTQYLTAFLLDISVSDDNSYLWTAHAVTAKPLPDSPLTLFVGPGAAFGTDDADPFWGLSSVLGVFFDKSRFEVFLQLTPRIILLPDIRGEFGSAVGLRYYL